jgi:DNA repair exonuclease SbcCD nuclease subunit
MQSDNPLKSAQVRIALVSDTHLSCGPDGTGPLYRQRLDRVIAAVNASGVDLVLFAGDLTDDAAPEDVAMALERLRQFTVPVCCVPGNHDVGEKLSVGGTNPVTEARLDDYEDRIGPAFFVERFVNRVCVVGVTASLFNSGLPREEEQWNFLADWLGAPTQETTVLLTHYPPFVEAPDEPADQWNIDPASRRPLLTLLQQSGVCAVLSGHTHHPLTRRHEGILFATAPAVAFGLPWGRQPEGWMLLTITQANEVNIVVRDI